MDNAEENQQESSDKYFGFPNENPSRNNSHEPQKQNKYKPPYDFNSFNDHETPKEEIIIENNQSNHQRNSAKENFEDNKRIENQSRISQEDIIIRNNESNQSGNPLFENNRINHNLEKFPQNNDQFRSNQIGNQQDTLRGYISDHNNYNNFQAVLKCSLCGGETLRNQSLDSNNPLNNFKYEGILEKLNSVYKQQSYNREVNDDSLNHINYNELCDQCIKRLTKADSSLIEKYLPNNYSDKNFIQGDNNPNYNGIGNIAGYPGNSGRRVFSDERRILNDLNPLYPENNYPRPDLREDKLNQDSNKKGNENQKNFASFLTVYSAIITFLIALLIYSFWREGKSGSLNPNPNSNEKECLIVDKDKKAHGDYNINYNFEEKFCQELTSKIESYNLYDSEMKNEVKERLKPIFANCNIQLNLPKFSRNKSNIYKIRKFSKNHYYEYHVQHENENYDEEVEKERIEYLAKECSKKRNLENKLKKRLKLNPDDREALSELRSIDFKECYDYKEITGKSLDNDI